MMLQFCLLVLLFAVVALETSSAYSYGAPSSSSSFSSSDSSAFTGRRTITTQQQHQATSSNGLSMKIFDWKRRQADESAINDVDNFIFDETNLKRSPGSAHRKARKGRGISAGQGASCGFGMRGQKSRSGPNVRVGFEGGQTVLARRMPKFPTKPMGRGHRRKLYSLIKLEDLNEVRDGETVNWAMLEENMAVNKTKYVIHKVVTGRKEYTAKNIVVQAHAFTRSARDAIEANGGRCELVKRTTGEIIDMEEVMGEFGGGLRSLELGGGGFKQDIMWRTPREFNAQRRTRP
jgi:large subunit ribosomal protein L15